MQVYLASDSRSKTTNRTNCHLRAVSCGFAFKVSVLRLGKAHSLHKRHLVDTSNTKQLKLFHQKYFEDSWTHLPAYGMQITRASPRVG